MREARADEGPGPAAYLIPSGSLPPRRTQAGLYIYIYIYIYILYICMYVYMYIYVNMYVFQKRNPKRTGGPRMREARADEGPSPASYLISQYVSINKQVLESQLPRKIVNLLFTVTNQMSR